MVKHLFLNSRSLVCCYVVFSKLDLDSGCWLYCMLSMTCALGSSRNWEKSTQNTWLADISKNTPVTPPVSAQQSLWILWVCVQAYDCLCVLDGAVSLCTMRRRFTSQIYYSASKRKGKKNDVWKQPVTLKKMLYKKAIEDRRNISA